MLKDVISRFLDEREREGCCPKRLVLGFSGGLDSTALLFGVAAVAKGRGLPVLAVHVHHGLSTNADSWAVHCEQVAAGLGVGIEVARVVVPAGPSLENQARQARQRAFASLLSGGDVLLLAQHAGDQAETVLFRLLRGTGLTGLSAMRPVDVFVAGALRIPLWRPLLGLERSVLEEFVRGSGVVWIEDESNQDVSLSRNYLRHEIFPLLQTRWPGAQRHLVALAEDAGAAIAELEMVTREDWLQCRRPDDGLSLGGLLGLSPPRQRRLVRHWLQESGYDMPSRLQLEQVLGGLVGAADDACPCVRWGNVEVHRYRGALHAVHPVCPFDSSWSAFWDGLHPLRLPDGRRLELFGAGGALTEGLQVRFRQGGERVSLPDGHSKLLKKHLQEQGVPPWERDRLPLLFGGDRLLAVGETLLPAAKNTCLDGKSLKIS